jgi:hypothetical protein
MSIYIIVSGIDGSGKTTVIEGIRSQLEAKNMTVGYIWMRYNHYLIKVMHAIAKVIGLSTKEQTPMGCMWLHQFYKSPIFCWFYVRCSYIDNWFAKRKVKRIKADYIICDRWVNDILIDVGAECHYTDILDSKWYSRFHNLLPPDCYQFVVVRKKKKVLDCRIENTFNEAFTLRYDLYKKITDKKGVNLVDNNGSIENSVQQVLNVLFPINQ